MSDDLVKLLQHTAEMFRRHAKQSREGADVFLRAHAALARGQSVTLPDGTTMTRDDIFDEARRFSIKADEEDELAETMEARALAVANGFYSAPVVDEIEEWLQHRPD